MFVLPFQTVMERDTVRVDHGYEDTMDLHSMSPGENMEPQDQPWRPKSLEESMERQDQPGRAWSHKTSRGEHGSSRYPGRARSPGESKEPQEEQGRPQNPRTSQGEQVPAQ